MVDSLTLGISFVNNLYVFVFNHTAIVFNYKFQAVTMVCPCFKCLHVFNEHSPFMFCTLFNSVDKASLELACINEINRRLQI